MAIANRLRFHDGLSRAFQGNLEWYDHGIERYAKQIANALESYAPPAVPSDSVQHALRPLYGKGEPQLPCIGDHPDFLELKGTDETCYCGIATLFMDIESSTRLSHLYELDDVRKIKNAIIRTAIDIIKCFDGHVHRIMGDAVMAYFGGRNASVEEPIIDAVNAAAILQYFAKEVVIPQLAATGYDHDFGIRIGLDYGSHEDVLWSSYGFPGMNEVTATSFYVDVAAKLQHAAGRNQIMVGESLRRTIDFPAELLQTKVVTRNGQPVPEPYVSPNHTDRDGKLLNYRQHILRGQEYLLCSPCAQGTAQLQLDADAPPIRVFAEVFDENRTVSEGPYFATSEALPKRRSLRFTASLPPLIPPFDVVCRVENHGEDARARGGDNSGDHFKRYTIESAEQRQLFEHWEETAYRGLHYLDLQVLTDRGVEYKTRFGVYIE